MAGKFRLLIVDDNAELTETFKDIFELKGFEVVTALDGEQALAEVRKQDFDVVLLDLVLPGMNGAATLREIRKLNDQTKFVVVTAYTGSEQVEEVKNNGALRVFAKPLVVKEIVELIGKLRDEARAQEA
jgi:two-component system response regulator (stage 0 sporulation protein F)